MKRSGVMVATVGGAVIALAAATSEAGTITVADVAKATYGYDSGAGTLTVTLENLLPAGQTNGAANLLTGFQFSWAGATITYGSGDASYGGGVGPYITVADDGSVSTATPPADIGWSINDTSQINPIPAGATLLSFSPNANMSLIGRQDGGDSGGYTANGSIEGNGAHNPFAYRQATFVLGVTGSGLDEADIEKFVFYFGTGLEGRVSVAPLPSAAWMGLLGLGGLGLLQHLRRRRQRTLDV